MTSRIFMFLALSLVSCDRSPESVAPTTNTFLAHSGIIEFDIPGGDSISDPTSKVPRYKLSDGSFALVYGFLAKNHFDLRHEQEHLTTEEQRSNQSLAMGISVYRTKDEELENGLKGGSYIWIDKETGRISQCRTILYNETEHYGLEVQVYDADSLSFVDAFLKLLSGIVITKRDPSP